MKNKMLKNCWYVAAFASEIQQDLFERTICGMSLLFYRLPDGKAVALSNACVHRYSPLSAGKLLAGGVVECAYHGLRFDSSGQCVHNPHGSGEIPKRACVKSFPLVEKYSLLWVWLGDPELADDAAIPDFSCLSDPEFVTVGGVMDMKGNYELVTDNLMDLTHVEFLHEGVLGSEAISRGDHEVLQEGTTIWSNRWCPDGLAPPAWAQAFDNYQDNVDHWLYMRWDAPAHMLLDVGVTPRGDTREQGRYVYGTDILTPKDDSSTWYFWGITRNYALTDPAVCDMWRKAIELAFGTQDKPMIEAQQRMLHQLGAVDVSELDPVLLASDSGSVRVRRILDMLRKAESSRAVPDPRNPSLRQLRDDNTARVSDRIVPVV